MPTLNLFATPVLIENATVANYDPCQIEVRDFLNYVKESKDYNGVSYIYRNAAETRKEVQAGFHIKDNVVKERNMVNLEKRIMDAVEFFTLSSQWFGTNKPGKFVLDNSWINIAEKGVKHEYHSHPGYDIVGVYYFRVNEEQGGINFNSPNPMLYNGYFPSGDRYPGSINIIPKDGDIILFPSWLQHSTDANKSDEERVTIAFNLKYVED